MVKREDIEFIKTDLLKLVSLSRDENVEVVADICRNERGKLFVSGIYTGNDDMVIRSSRPCGKMGKKIGLFHTHLIKRGDGPETKELSRHDIISNITALDAISCLGTTDDERIRCIIYSSLPSDLVDKIQDIDKIYQELDDRLTEENNREEKLVKMLDDENLWDVEIEINKRLITID